MPARRPEPTLEMNMFSPEPTLEDFTKLLSETEDGNGSSKPAPNGNGNSSRNSIAEVTENWQADLESDTFNLASEEVEPSPEPQPATQQDMQQVIRALTGLKSELKRAGLLDKPNVQNLFRQVAEFAAVQPKVANQLPAATTAKQLRYQRALAFGIRSQLRQAEDAETLLQIAVKCIREIMQVDRLLVCRTSDNMGKVVGESLRRGWTPMNGEAIALTAFGLEQIEDYVTQQVAILEDVNRVESTPYQRQLLEKFQVKASLALPIVVAGQPWGLLVAHQCGGCRPWQETEISLLYQISLELAVNLQRFEFDLKLQSQANQEKAVVRVIDRIRQSVDIETIFKTTTQEVRQLLRADRVAVYRFNEDWGGEFISESVGSEWIKLVGSDHNTVWEDTYLQETQGGRYRNNETFVVNDIYNTGHHQCHIEILEQFEARAYIIAPVFFGRKLWGLLAVYQNSGARTWKDSEISFVSHIGNQFGTALQMAESLREARIQADRKRVVTNIVDRIRQASDIPSALRTTTQEVRQLLKADRVAIYRFNEDWGGEFIAESVANGWAKLVGIDVKTVWEDTHLKETQGGRYRNNETFAVHDIYEAGHYQCHLEILEQFEVRAYMIVPIFAGQKLWGLLAAYQNSAPRHWETGEVELLAQIAAQIGYPVQQSETLLQAQQQAERERALNRIIENIRKSLDVGMIFKSATEEIRQLLKVDRVGIYRFNEDWSGQVIAESVSEGWAPVMPRQMTEPILQGKAISDPSCILSPSSDTIVDTYFQESQGGKFAKGMRIMQVDDVQAMNYSSCYLELLQQFQARAYLMVPVYQGSRLWGLLACYQCSGSRRWQESEATLMMQIAVQMGVALNQADLLRRTQLQAERERILVRVNDRIRESLDLVRQSFDINAIFSAATQEVRQLLKADRVAVYRFNPDWSGDFVTESIGAGGWVKLVGTETGSTVRDSYLTRTEGGRYRNGESLAVHDIYEVGHDPCHVGLLEQFQARAYMLVPIFIERQLWGLLATYQNSGPRNWEDAEVTMLNQIAAQIGVALEQAASLTKLQEQSAQLAQAAAREKAAKEQLQQQVIQLLAAIKPVFAGDLTIRVPVSENEVGTIADAYNNTIQSLRKIVTQVQVTSTKVTQTSRNSSNAIAKLSQQADEQLQEVTRALDQIQAMVSSTQAVATNAKQVESAVQQANQTVRAGDAAMNKTVDSILAIRETVAETTKKIKRLSESSQKISKVVSLISNFTTQTQLLALNASIEATRAGEYGRGFTVVADEVRSLARQSADATREIEKLAQEIQSETSDVATAMDAGIQQVVSGTSLVNETRQQLTEIMNATAQISQLVQGITQATLQQTQQSQLVTQAMTDVATIANKNSAQSGQISASFQELLTTAQQLQTSVGQFKVN